MEERLESILAWLEQVIASTSDFLTEQTPLVIREILLYHRVYYSTGIVLGAMLILVSMFRLWRNWGVWLANSRTDSDSKGGDLSGEAFFHYVTIAVPSVVGLAFMATAFDGFIKVWFAPRLFLLEWIRRFV